MNINIELYPMKYKNPEKFKLTLLLITFLYHNMYLQFIYNILCMLLAIYFDFYHKLHFSCKNEIILLNMLTNYKKSN
jgi:hypothetical protein